ncbi:MAG: TetR/AcrR family transcriptional regulator [Pseudomonadales bacterium]|nr:TetR/AcrR family transcriptional regulator [Pseudomonadales bacterium]
MKRRNPKQQRSKETVNRILRALNRIIESDGYPYATTAKIAKEAKLGIATLYGYFDDKEDILISLLNSQADEAILMLNEGLPSWIGGDRKLALRAFIEFAVNKVINRAALTKTVMMFTPHLIESPKAARLVGQFEMVLDLISKKNSADSNMIPVDSFIMTNALLGLILGLASGLPEGVSAEDVIDRLENVASSFQTLRAV